MTQLFGPDRSACAEPSTWEIGSEGWCCAQTIVGWAIDVDSAVARALQLSGMSISEPRNESLSQRELRNESGRVLREVSEGRSFVLTNSGVPVGRIVPIDAPAPALTIARPARRAGGWAALAIERKTATRSLAETLDDLRGDRL